MIKYLLCIYLFVSIEAFEFRSNTHHSKKIRRADSNNGFDFTSNKHHLQNLNYGITQRTKKMFELCNSFRDKNSSTSILPTDDDKDPVIINVPYGAYKAGYPRQSYLNFTLKSMHDDNFENEIDDSEDDLERNFRKMMKIPPGVRIIRIKNPNVESDEHNNEKSFSNFQSRKQSGKKKSDNFEVIENQDSTFQDVGGYEQVKDELMQTVDILKHYEKYANYSVRIPKGILLEGPPGNGKTLLAKAFSGEVNTSFITVSGSQFTEKFVGVGASRIRELFQLAEENIPCIIFIDEIDALGRSRTSNDEVSNPNTEAQSTLNELLVRMDGYKSSGGIFIIGATNRGDLLDSALLRPGRIDKRVYIGNPDAHTREQILKIHASGKPTHSELYLDDLVEMTSGLSGAQIENLLNEGMLLALRDDRTELRRQDLDTILSRMLVGYQSSENSYSEDMIRRIAIHELGHAIVGVLSLHHADLVKICLNSWSPTSPGYTIFETVETDSSIYTKEKLHSRLMVLLGGRIAEEIFFGASITSGASKDIEDAYTLAEQMIVKFGMGRKIVYPHHSESSKTFIDKDIETLIEKAYQAARAIIYEKRVLIEDCVEELIKNKILLPDTIYSKLSA